MCVYKCYTILLLFSFFSIFPEIKEEILDLDDIISEENLEKYIKLLDLLTFD